MLNQVRYDVDHYHPLVKWTAIVISNSCLQACEALKVRGFAAQRLLAELVFICTNGPQFSTATIMVMGLCMKFGFPGGNHATVDICICYSTFNTRVRPALPIRMKRTICDAEGTHRGIDAQALWAAVKMAGIVYPRHEYYNREPHICEFC